MTNSDYTLEFFAELKLDNNRAMAMLEMTRAALRSFVAIKQNTPFALDLLDCHKEIVQETAKLEWGNNTFFKWHETGLAIENLEFGEVMLTY